MRSHYPELLASVDAAVAQREQQRVVAERGAQLRRERDEQGLLDHLEDCVLLGGYGLAEGVAAGDRVDLHFTRQELWLTKSKGSFPYLRVGYADARALDFEGGMVRSGGGYAGGGFGLIGAVEGVAMALS